MIRLRSEEKGNCALTFFCPKCEREDIIFMYAPERCHWCGRFIKEDILGLEISTRERVIYYSEARY
jgi:ribosomal protein S27E